MKFLIILNTIFDIGYSDLSNYLLSLYKIESSSGLFRKQQTKRLPWQRSQLHNPLQRYLFTFIVHYIAFARGFIEVEVKAEVVLLWYDFTSFTLAFARGFTRVLMCDVIYN